MKSETTETEPINSPWLRAIQQRGQSSLTPYIESIHKPILTQSLQATLTTALKCATLDKDSVISYFPQCCENVGIISHYLCRKRCRSTDINRIMNETKKFDQLFSLLSLRQQNQSSSNVDSHSSEPIKSENNGVIPNLFDRISDNSNNNKIFDNGSNCNNNSNTQSNIIPNNNKSKDIAGNKIGSNNIASDNNTASSLSGS